MNILALFLDTNILIEIEQQNETVIKKLEEIAENFQQNFAIASPAYSEFYFGYLSNAKKSKEFVVEKLENLEFFNTSKNSSKIFAEKKLELEKKGKKVPDFDLLIASIVLDNNSTLITKDEHFKGIKELKTVFV